MAVRYNCHVLLFTVYFKTTLRAGPQNMKTVELIVILLRCNPNALLFIASNTADLKGRPFERDDVMTLLFNSSAV